MSILIILLDRWRGAKVGKKIQRTSGPPRIQALRCTGKKPKQIRFGKAVQIDHEIKPTAAHIFDYLKNPQDRERLESIAQADTIDGDGRIGATGHLDYFHAGLADCDCNARMRKAPADCAERRQTHDHVTELAEINDEYVARVETHFRCLSKKSALA